MPTAHPTAPSVSDATSHTASSVPANLPEHSPAGGATGGHPSGHPSGHQSLVPTSVNAQFRQTIALSAQVARLPVELDVSVPISNFRVRNLLSLESSHLIESGWAHGEDMPLAAGAVQLAWSEFEVIDTQLAVRVTRMA